MKKLPYTISQVEFLTYLNQKITDLFSKQSASAHDIDHVCRVVEWTREIAVAERAKSVFLCEVSAWLHDIGRIFEPQLDELSNSHAEYSYQVLRRWFNDDRHFDFFTKGQKLELLYCVRYHWNNAANKYDTAWILRDADKLDGFGNSGINRMLQAYGNNEKELNKVLRYQADNLANIRTKTARKIIKQQRLYEPIVKEYLKYLRLKITSVEL